MKIFKKVTRIIFALLFVAAGANHFINPQFYQNIMPPYLPWHSAMIVISGIAEIVLGFCLVINSLSRPAAWGLIALLIAIFPVHIHMLTHSELYPDIPVAILWLRIALQAVLILWAFWYTRGNPLP